MKHNLLFGLFLIYAALFNNSACADDSVKRTDNTTVTLFHNAQDEVLLKFEIRPNWHISWSNPGDVGQSTTIKAENSELKIIAQSTPTARTIFDTMHEYFYENIAYYSLQLSDLHNAELKLDFVECSDVCKPETLSFKPMDIAATPNDKWQDLISIATQTFPQKITLSSPQNHNRLQLALPYSESVYFAPTQKDVIDESEIEITPSETGIQIRWQNTPSSQLKQALIMTPQQSFLADIQYINNTFSYLFYMILFAFIGGILLNAMPCVFPILSLKIFNLIKQPRQNFMPFKNALLYTCGVFLSFMLLTAVLIALKSGGENVGWGFQLQSPWFVGIMAVLFLVLFLYMTELWHFPNLVTQKIHKLAGINEFATGFFAVLIASPCTGPFMGAAVGYALTRSVPEIFAVFGGLALGYALPYALIELYPHKLCLIMPKPGRWMRKLQIILSLPLLFTSVWLGSVLYAQLTTTENTEKTLLNWQPLDAALVEQLNNKGANIFIDFTADWCLTCQFNHKIILNTERFANFVHKNNVHLFVADMTEYNPEYNVALQSYGRDSIPLYVYYHNGSYELLPLFFRVGSLPH
ncbi:MAG: thioredoxin family protein [Alphaproteobacteria bacterium]|nr:thioredoxin family protein [Alphaproteobacteria bacterium]